MSDLMYYYLGLVIGITSAVWGMMVFSKKNKSKIISSSKWRSSIDDIAKEIEHKTDAYMLVALKEIEDTEKGVGFREAMVCGTGSQNHYKKMLEQLLRDDEVRDWTAEALAMSILDSKKDEDIDFDKISLKGKDETVKRGRPRKNKSR